MFTSLTFDLSGERVFMLVGYKISYEYRVAEDIVLE